MPNLPAWILDKHRQEQEELGRRLYRDRLEAANLAPWRSRGQVDQVDGPPSRPPSEIEQAVKFYAAAHYQPGDGPLDFDWTDRTALELAQEKASLYLNLCQLQTGDTIPDDVLEQRRRDQVKLRDMTHQIARRLELEGIPAYRREGLTLWHYYVHSNHLEQIPSFKRHVMLPYMAAMTRAPMLSAAESFLERNPYSRFWTFTSGLRCNVLQLRQRLRYMHRKISKLNGEPFMQNAGIEIVLRSTELGRPENEGDAGAIDQENGEVLFHPHAHCIVHLKKGFIPRDRWKKVLESVWNYWGHHWDDGSAIEDARECLKYVTKPGEMLRIPGETLGRLWAQVRRMKLAQPMGALAAEIKRRYEEEMRLVRVSTSDGAVFREVRDWNRLPPMTEEQKHRAAARKLDAKDADAAAITRVVSRLLPAIGPAGVKEPRMVIMTNEGLNVALLRHHPAIAPVIAITAAEFRAGLAIRVHTCTPTVLPGLDFGDLGRWKPPDPGNPGQDPVDRAIRRLRKNAQKSDLSSPHEGDFAQVDLRNPPRRATVRLGRVWATLSGEVRFDIAPGQGFRPGTSVDSSQINSMGVSVE